MFEDSGDEQRDKSVDWGELYMHALIVMAVT